MLCRRRADVYIWFYEKSTKIQFHCAQRNQTDWLIVLSISFDILPYLISENKFISFLQNWVLYSTGQENEQKRICTSDFVLAGTEQYPLITSNFLFRFTRNAWTTETSTIPYWNWEELNLKIFFFSSVAHRSSDSFLFRLVSGAYTRTSKLFSNTSRLFWFNARNEVDRRNFSIHRG